MLLDRVLASAHRTERQTERSPVTHVRRVSARAGSHAPWPSWVPSPLVERLGAQGIGHLWEHQAHAASLAWAGTSLVVATGTASGKSLSYQVPVLSTLLLNERATALYLAPTKALANDQLRSVTRLDLAGIRAAGYDGDTPVEERRWVRAHGRLVFTNPDMLHRGILPAHAQWRSFLRRLRFVVVDECHIYRGVFGSHVSHVLRRLRRICAGYGVSPVFVLASATVARPAELGTQLTGLDMVAVTEDGSPRGGSTFALWEPPLTDTAGENGAPVRRSATAEAAQLLAELVGQGARTLAFVRSRAAAEVAVLSARRMLQDAAPELADRIAAYRGGYLPEERRALERSLLDGTLVGAAATNALELGVDIAGLDAVVLAGFPGTLASLWQQAGRAGRAGQGALVVFVARDDPLDTYLVHHPEAVFGRPVEATVLDPDNPHVLGPQLCCAAAESPLRADELHLFGENTAAALGELERDRSLRRRPAGWYWTASRPPAVDIRGSGDEPVTVVEAATGRVLGTVDGDTAPATVHSGAVYLHQSRSYLVDELDLDGGVALVHAEEPDWTTWSRQVTDIRIHQTLRTRDLGEVTIQFGSVQVSNQVVSYLRRRVANGSVLDEVPLDLPSRTLLTRAVWYTVDESALARVCLSPTEVPGAAHAAEHAAIGLLPLLATCDRWDIGGVSTATHQDTGRCTVFVYDGQPGGAGFAARGYDAADRWLRATRGAIACCECDAGCPSCVQSPKCGNGNEPLDKAGAVRLLDAVLAAYVRP
ncbi:MAG TPA: DEAD/DEAH box helicase [Mycobacteriales bacterium]|nr:DEAD/DEAH box helicase [Mycobacteriales bacterium]